MYDHVTSTVTMEDDFEAYQFHVRVCRSMDCVWVFCDFFRKGDSHKGIDRGC